MTSAQNLQIVFSESGAGALNQARRKSSNSDWAVAMPRLFCKAVGPIQLLMEPRERVHWIRNNAPELFDIFAAMFDSEAPENAIARQWQVFLERVSTWRDPVTIWYSSADMDDMCCLIGMCSVWKQLENVFWIDVSALTSPVEGVRSVGNYAPETLLEATRLAVPMTDDNQKRLANQKSRLMHAAKGLRVFDNGQIEEVGLDHQDDQILDQIDDDWAEFRKVFAAVWNQGLSTGVSDRDYFFLLSRLHHLTKTGRIERRGESQGPLFFDNPLAGDVRRKTYVKD